MFHSPPDAATPRSWKTFLGGLTAAVLLLPVPAYATLTWGSFNTSSGVWTSNGGLQTGNSDTLTITVPSGGSGNATFTFTSAVVQTNHSTDVITPGTTGANFNLYNGETLAITYGVSPNSGQTTVTQSGNMFTAMSTGQGA